MVKIEVIKYPSNFHVNPDEIPDLRKITDYFQLRDERFNKDKKWSLHSEMDPESNKTQEYDPYDIFSNSEKYYIIAYDNNEVMGGARLLRTTHKDATGIYSYMIRDAYLGLLDNIPSTICAQKPPVDKDIWEITRLATKKQSFLGADLILAGLFFLKSQKAKSCLFLGSPAFQRIGMRMGFDTTTLGETVRSDIKPYVGIEYKLETKPEYNLQKTLGTVHYA